MARRKPELLDLLRRQAEEKEARKTDPLESELGREGAPSGAPSVPRPGSQAEDFAFSSSQEREEDRRPRFRLPPLDPEALAGIPWMPLALVVVLAIPLFWWIAQGLSGGDGVQAADSGKAAAPALTEGAGPGPASLPGDASAPPAGGAPDYSILVVTYDDSKANEDLARRTRLLLEEAGFPKVTAVLVPSDHPTHIEVFVGRASRPALLEPLLARIQKFNLPGKPGQRPFADAVVRRHRLLANH